MRDRQATWRIAPINAQSADAAKPANVHVALAAAVFGTWLLLTSTSAHAQTPTSAQLDAQELHRTQGREAQLRAQQERVPDVLSPTTESVQALRLPTAEAPCFKIQQLELRGDEGGRFGWVLDALAGPKGNDAPLRKCLGAQGVAILQQRAQDALIQQGFVTTRILVQPQDMSNGSLVFTMVPGSLHTVRPSADAPSTAVIPARQQQLQSSPDVRRTLAPDARRLQAGEQPCFRLKEIVITGAQGTQVDIARLLFALHGTDGDDVPQGRCVGAHGVALLISRAQDALIAQGFVTSRVLAPPQDLSVGRLELQVILGRIEHIRLAKPDDRATLRNAMPMREGDVLQLRDVEQTLENLKRVPTAEVDIQIEPGQQPGGSDLVVSWTQSKPWRLSLSVDDSGSDSSGKYQGAATLSFDHALTLNDLFYMTTMRDLGGGDPGYRGTQGLSTHYSVPFGYWLLSLNSSKTRYFQTVAGTTQDYLYSGRSANQDIILTHLFARDAVSKSSWSIKTFARQSENFIDDTEVEVQRRRFGGYELGLQHKTQWADWQVDAASAYKRGTKAFGANKAPEDAFGEGTHQFKLWVADVQWQTPMTLKGRRWHYQGSWRWQNNQTPLTPQDRLSIGGRYSVRGFDGERSLLGDRGYWLRNEWGTALGDTRQRIYLALDYGQVNGTSTQNLPGRHLTGLALALRGAVSVLQYDVFVGVPVDKPQGFKTADTTAGLSLSGQF